MTLSCVKKEELAYLAGFIDGEGTISIQSGGSGYMRPIVSVANSNRIVLDFINFHWRGSVYSQKGWGVNAKQIHWVRVVNKNAIELIKDLLPYLNQKLPQARIVIKWYETIKNRKRKNNRFIKQIKILNKRGI
jgi:hypothetical protein